MMISLQKTPCHHTEAKEDKALPQTHIKFYFEKNRV